MKKLNSIVICTGIFPPDIGGPASFIPILANGLVEHGIKVTVITLSDNLHDDSHRSYPVIRINRKIKKPFRDIIVIKEIIKASKECNLIFSNTLAFESAIASLITRKIMVQKIVGDIAWERMHGSGKFTGNLEEYQKGDSSISSKITNWYRNFSVQKSTLIITPSAYLKNIITQWGYPVNKIEVIYNAVRFEYADTSIPKSKFRIISIARLIPLKGIEGILKALSHLDFDFEYIIIGDGPLKNNLKQLADNLHIDIKFIGNISQKEVAIWLQSSDLFIQNSIHETMPHVILEAMINKCPVIASSVGGTREIITDYKNGLLFHYNDINEMIEKIKLVKNATITFELIQNGHIFAEKFASIPFMISQYIHIFQKVIHSRQ